jgi:hypothetical protein
MGVLSALLLLVAVGSGAAFVGRMAHLAKKPDVPEGDRPRQRWTVAWVVWLVVAAGGFFTIEVPALINDSGGDTLTEHIQYAAGQSPAWTYLIGGGIVAFFAWFMPHLFGKNSRVWGYLKSRRK